MARKTAAKPPKKKPDLKAKIPAIIERIVEGESLRAICRDKDMPNVATFLRWVAEDDVLCKQYARAMELRADTHHEEIFEIADDGRNDWMEIHDKDGNSLGWKLNGEAVARSKLRVDARKWSTARMAPKKYGDKLELGSDPDRPLVTRIERQIVKPKEQAE